MRSYEMYTKNTKQGLRYYRWSTFQLRAFPVSAAQATADLLSGGAHLVERTF